VFFCMSSQPITPFTLVLIAIVSIGGVLFIGWQANVVGNVASGYIACCTVQTWSHSPAGYIASPPVVTNEVCAAGEFSYQCCARAGAAHVKPPIRVLASRTGSCSSPEISYPAGPFEGYDYAICCTTEAWWSSPIGYTQGEAQTGTEYCSSLETPESCCLRERGARATNPIKLLGARRGEC